MEVFVFALLDKHVCNKKGGVGFNLYVPLHKESNVSLRVSLVNVTKSAVSFVFGHIY